MMSGGILSQYSMENKTSIQCSKGLLWISARVKTDNLLRLKVHRAIGLRSSDNNDNVQESKVTVHLLSGQNSTTLFTVRSKSVQHRYRNNTCILKYNGVFYLNTCDEGSHNRRLCFTVYVTNGDVSESMTGCFSLSFASLSLRGTLRDFETVNGWYAILPRDQGQVEHILVLAESPRGLLHGLKSEHHASRSIHDVNDDDIALPVSDGSVCGGHIKDGQLETDVDAAFCCLQDEPRSTADRSSYEHNSAEVSCFHSQNAILNITTQGYMTPSSRFLYENHTSETPCRYACHIQLLRDSSRRMNGNRLGLRKLEYGNLYEDNDSEQRFTYGQPRDGYNHGIHGKEKAVMQKKAKGDLTTCCSTANVLECIKSQVRKMKSTSSGHIAVNLRNSRNDIIGLNRKVKVGVATENSFSRSNANGNNLHFETWCSEKTTSQLESFLVPEEHYYPQSSISPICRSIEYRKYPCSVSATSTPVCYLEKTKLMASHKRQVCFYKSNQLGSELGIRLAERHNSSKQRIVCKDTWNMLETSADTIASNYPIRAKRLFTNCSTPLIRGIRNSSLCRTPTNLRSQNISAFLTKYPSCDLQKISIFDNSGPELTDVSGYIRQDTHDNSVCLESFEDESGSYEHLQRSIAIESHGPASIHSTDANLIDTFSKQSLAGHAPLGRQSRVSTVSMDSSTSSNCAISLSSDGSSSSGSSSLSSSSSENCTRSISMDTCKVIIAEVAEGSAAEVRGLEAGDGISYINGYDVRNLSSDQVVKILTNINGDIKIEIERIICLDWIK